MSLPKKLNDLEKYKRKINEFEKFKKIPNLFFFKCIRENVQTGAVGLNIFIKEVSQSFTLILSQIPCVPINIGIKRRNRNPLVKN